MYNFTQGRQTKIVSWTVKSLNDVIGQIGGYVALIWMVVKFIFDDYENFKFTNSLITRIYACTIEGPDAQEA